MSLVNACLLSEERLHRWAIANLEKTDQFWWKINDKHMNQMLQDTGLSREQYNALVQKLRLQFGESTGCD